MPGSHCVCSVVLKAQCIKNSALDYSAIDNKPFAGGRSYYRLKQTDFDGRHTYSSLRMIDNATVGTYPIPVRAKKLTIELNNALPSEVIPVRTINAQGASEFDAKCMVDNMASSVAGSLHFVNIISSPGMIRKVFIE